MTATTATATAQPAVALSPPVGALVDAVRGAVAELRGRAPGQGAGSWPQAEREETIAALDGLVTELTVYRGQVLRCHEQAGAWGSVSDRDFADYRSRTTGTGRGAAMGEVQLAQGLEQLPALAEAVAGGKVHLEHARTVTRLHRTASPEVQQALTDEGGLERLLRQVERDKLTAPQLGKAAKAWAATIDAAAAQRDFDKVRVRRSLTMRKQAGGIAGEFFLDPLAGEELRTALEAISGRPADNDERTREQRMADALTTMAGRTLQVGSDLVGAQVRPHLALLVSEDTWAGICARRRAFESCPAGTRPPWPDVAPAELEDGTTVAPSELERLMCDSEVTRMVMTAQGIPLDVGRTQRTYTKELRRAVLTRDRHCQWPSCRLRASWCEVHHITWFSRGGHTSLPEAITLCSYHHHRVHEADVSITVLAEGFDFHFPSGTHIGTTRRDQPPGGPDNLLPCPSQAAQGRAVAEKPGRGAPGTQAPSAQPGRRSPDDRAPRSSHPSHSLQRSRSPQVRCSVHESHQAGPPQPPPHRWSTRHTRPPNTSAPPPRAPTFPTRPAPVPPRSSARAGPVSARSTARAGPASAGSTARAGPVSAGSTARAGPDPPRP